MMNRIAGLLSAAGIGAGCMYLFDPDRGKRRRAELRNKAKHINHIAIEAAGKTQRDLRNRLLGSGLRSGLSSVQRQWRMMS
jgi:hypothetical protein